jgi:hypothetical protein
MKEKIVLVHGTLLVERQSSIYENNNINLICGKIIDSNVIDEFRRIQTKDTVGKKILFDFSIAKKNIR